jgi:hypothetical protein
VQELLFWNGSKLTSDRTSIESNVGDYFTQNTPLLDTYSGAAAAYSLRLLDSTYTGSAIRVRRSSDNTEQDINFNVFGELDTVSLLAFAGAGDAFVKTWYDQSGNSNDATQTTTANHPQIVSSGAVVTENGKPAVQFDGVSEFLEGSSGYDFSAMFATSVYSGMSLNDHILGAQSTNNDGWRLHGRSDARLRVATSNVDISGVSNLGTHCIQSSTIASGTATNYLNSVDSASASVTIGTTTSISFKIGTSYQFEYASGKIQEVIFYTSDQSSNRTGIETNVNTFYSIF